VNATDGEHWTNTTYTFTTEANEAAILLDSEFINSIDSADLRTNATSQDWYESRGQAPTLLFLDENNIGRNTGKKAGFTASSSTNAYLSQEFSTPQTSTFTAQWDIYVDSILDISSPDRAGWMLIGDDTYAGSGPNANNAERFVYMAFYKLGGGTTGTMDLIAIDRDDTFTSFTTVATGLNLKQWYTIKVDCNLSADTYDVYVDGIYQKTVTSRIVKASVTHISFAQWNDGAGSFYVDNVFSPARERYRLTTTVNGQGSIIITPGEATYAYGATVQLTAVPTIGWSFTSWSGDLISTDNPDTITITGSMNVDAQFTKLEYSLTTATSGTGTGTITRNNTGHTTTTTSYN
jgi:hypothetical protein